MALYTLSRQMRVEETFDVCVVGGGPAGVCAAIAAARQGARVLLAEAMGCLGGMGTSGLVTAFDPMADGVRCLVGGIMNEIVEATYTAGYCGPDVTPDNWRKKRMTWTPFHPEGLKRVLDDLCLAAGVTLRFFTRVIDVDVTHGHINCVILSNIEGYVAVKARAYIDATGDAVLSALCLAPYEEAGRDTPQIMPATLASLFSGIDWENTEQYDQKGHRVTLLEQANAEGVLRQCDRHLPGMSRIGQTLGYLNGNHIFQLNAVKVDSLTQGMVLGRKLVGDYEAVFKRYFKGFEHMELVSTGALMGVRESRRIIGEARITLEDCTHRRHYPDQIAVYAKHVDIHPYDTSREAYQAYVDFYKDELGLGESYGLRYGILVPKGFENLWTAGRCVSADVPMQGAMRVMPACGMMGQAAGTAAVQAIHRGEVAHALDTQRLVCTLQKQGAYLPQVKGL